MPKTAVFLDRDGVINDNTNLRNVNKPEELVLYPWTAPAIRRLNQAGLLVFVVTNQGGIELGFLSHEDLKAIHARLEQLLSNEGAKIDEIVYCPHFRKPSKYRKPNPGMILDLLKKYHLNPANCWMIGDRDTDIIAGNAAGCKSIKLGTPDATAHYNCTHLGEAVDYILK